MSYPQLNQQLAVDKFNQKNTLDTSISYPDPATFHLPEKILQFGSGAFLRGFFDYFIHTANQQNRFNGRIVVAQSTGGKRSEILENQDGLYTLCAMGLTNGEPQESFTVCSSISRAIVANDDWQSVLSVAESPDLEIIVSNTTEAGVVFDETDRIDRDPPTSFPGKLTAVLYRRYLAFRGNESRGLIILPCELLENNGTVLRGIVLQLADMWQLGGGFKDWVIGANRFCNTLVDRIVPGKPDAARMEQLSAQLGFRDEMLTCSECYSLFAIEGGSGLQEKLSFCDSNPSIIVRENIADYRERKLRLLNASHTISVPLAYLSGFEYVIEMMSDPKISKFVETVMRREIGPCLEMDSQIVNKYIDDVLQRFRNPYLKHALLDITVQSTMKMRNRVLQLITRYHQKSGDFPKLICLGYAAYLRFMKAATQDGNHFFGEINGARYPVNDAAASYFMEQWQAFDAGEIANTEALVSEICHNRFIWPDNIDNGKTFIQQVSKCLDAILRDGPEATLATVLEEYN